MIKMGGRKKREPREIIDDMIVDVNNFRRGQEVSDDVAMLCLATTSEPRAAVS